MCETMRRRLRLVPTMIAPRTTQWLRQGRSIDRRRHLVLHIFFASMLVLSAGLPGLAYAEESPEFTPEQIEFFEGKVRPILIANCFECHSSDAKKLQGALKLDSREGALQGGDSGPAVVPGEADKSLMIDAVRWKQFEMPPSKKLPADQIETLAKWVTIGAPWPSAEESARTIQSVQYDWAKLQTEHWAWRPVQRPTLPSVNNTKWVKNEIDRFVLAKLEAQGLAPAVTADPRTLIRRVYFDLVGLPPAPERIEEFIRETNRDRDAAFTSLVDELLSSPHYGERWGRHWLDVARYSDGFGGFLDGAAQPNAWRYRDWVVAAFNRDLAIDQFLRLQLAGDLVEPPEPIATGFLALGPTYISDGGDPEATAQAMAETLADRVDTVTRGLLGLTAACSRCHDHKFDPIPQLDYYSLAGVFRNTSLKELPLVPAETVKAFNDHQTAIRNVEQKIAKRNELAKSQNRELNDEEKQQSSADTAELDQLKKSSPPPFPTAHTLTDSGGDDMRLAIRGNLRKPGPVAPRRFLRILAGDEPARFTRGSGRLELADALVSRGNPLTARVFVNRIWMQHFGQGLVRTPSNFGKLGMPPTHPELLDWLTSELMDQGWSLKKLHRSILLSATYQMGSEGNAQAFAVDGDNTLLWRMNPRRLDVEAWRDSFLTVTGEIDDTLGGPSIEQLNESRRRTLYGAVSRNGDRFPAEAFLRMFDFPMPRGTNEGRPSSIAPQQSLFLINSPFMAARARGLAARLRCELPDDRQRINRTYLLLYGRPPQEDEIHLGLQFLAETAGNLAGGLDRWEQYAQVLLCANEFMYVK